MSLIQSLDIEGYRSVGAKQTIDLSTPGLVLLTGENRDRGVSSGAGKSTLFKALCTCLFEECDDGSIKKNGVNTIAGNGCRIGVNFTSEDGTPYYAVYAYGHPTDGTDWYLWEWDGSKWNDKREEKKGDTKAIIERALSLNYEQFVNRAYMAQGKVAEFIERTQKERIDIFAGILNLSAIDRWVQSARDWRRDTEKEVAIGIGKLHLLEQQITQMQSGIKTPQEVAALVERLHHFDGQIAKNGEETATKRQCVERATALLNLKTQHQVWLARAQEIQAKKEGLPPIPPVYSFTEEGIKDLQAAVAVAWGRYESAKAELQMAEKRLKEVEGFVGHVICSSCEQEIDYDQRKILSLKYKEVVAETVRRVEEALAQKEDVEVTYQRARLGYDAFLLARSTHAAVDADIERTLLSLQQCEQKIRDSDYPVGDTLEQLNAAIATLTSEALALTQYRTNLAHVITMAKEAAAKYASLVQQKVTEERKNAALTERVAHLKKIESLLGDKGFRAYKIASSRVGFNQSLSNYLSILTDGEVEAELVTEVPKADGKGTKSELDILVRDGEKSGVPIRQYSGGEKATLSVSITGAFWDLAMQQSSGSVNVLLLDEPFAQMDDFGIQKTCRLLEMMRESGRIILVVTNEPKVRDLGLWDREIRAIKEGGLTHFEEFDLSSNH